MNLTDMTQGVRAALPDFFVVFDIRAGRGVLRCWAALEQGNVSDFYRYAGAAVALREFMTTAGVLP